MNLQENDYYKCESLREQNIILEHLRNRYKVISSINTTQDEFLQWPHIYYDGNEISLSTINNPGNELIHIWKSSMGFSLSRFNKGNISELTYSEFRHRTGINIPPQGDSKLIFKFIR